MSVYVARRERLLAKVGAEGVDAVLVTNPLNVTYLTGFGGEATHLILGPGRLLLVSDGRFLVQLQEECPDLEAYVRPPSQTLPEATGQTLVKLGLANVGFESAHLTVADFDNLKSKSGSVAWKPAADRVESLRMVKDASELALIREAIRLAEDGFRRFQASLRGDDTEKALHDRMENEIRLAGGRSTAFPTIAAVGDRAALPHALPSERRVREAPFLLLDWGADGARYKSDLTRVLWTRKPSSVPAELRTKLIEVYEVVQRARAAAMAAMRPGVEVGTVDAAARVVIAEAGYAEQFNHGLGHGFGLQIHEAPFMRPNNPAKLEEGMVITLEPGIYLPGLLGVRIEDDLLIGPEGPEMLTKLQQHPDELAVETAH